MSRRYLLAAWLTLACASCPDRVPARAEPVDPLPQMVQRVNNFLHRGEVDGVTLDTRHLSNFPEQIRLTVVSQLAGYCELYGIQPNSTTRQDVVDRADYLVRYQSVCRAFDSGDGMMAYSLLRAYEATGVATYRDAAQPILAWCRTMDETLENPNRVLMAAMALAEDYHLTGDPAEWAKLQAILTLVAREQHADGSFPHGCEAGHDIHYTAWMAMELDRIAQLVDEPDVPRMLTRAYAFLQDRVALDGTVGYQCVLASGATMYYYSQPFCRGDYDTRAWTNELAYHALLFDRNADPRYNGVMSRLLALDSQGAFPDKWDDLPPPLDPYYAWANSPRSVVRSSVIFWALASIQAERTGRARMNYGGTIKTAIAGSPRSGEAGTAAASASADLRLGPLSPNPARGEAWVGLRLARPETVRVTVWDPAGRRVRSLLEGFVGAGERRVRWDGRDDGGRLVPAGVYLVRLEADGQARSARLVWID